MLEAEERLHQAPGAGGTQQRARRARLRWIAATAASYGIDTVFLALFAATGTLPIAIPLAYTAAAAAICGTAYLAFARGWNLRSRDPNLTEPMILLAIVLQLCVATAAPQVAFPFLANLFTVFAFGMLWLTLRNAVAVWSMGVFGTGIVFYLAGERFGAPTGSGAEVFLSWFYFSLILGRCLLVSVAANETRARLSESRRQLADTLEQVQRLASRDELTRALNRRSLLAALERERSRAERSGAPFCVAMIDLDHFKKVNDTYGHAAGDAVLRAFAATAHETMRNTDIFGRYGGEEFLLILVGSAPPAALEAVERVRMAVAARDWRSIVPNAAVTMSAGAAGYMKGETVEHLLNRADQALYQAKHAGRNRTIVSRP
ncbi:MAG TPA: GGDEF domain-containing protein [Burkholderiales bacterium]|nr:GGDEF domain-containing protein [Burkholderiales bacterium]